MGWNQGWAKHDWRTGLGQYRSWIEEQYNDAEPYYEMDGGLDEEDVYERVNQILASRVSVWHGILWEQHNRLTIPQTELARRHNLSQPSICYLLQQVPVLVRESLTSPFSAQEVYESLTEDDLTNWIAALDSAYRCQPRPTLEEFRAHAYLMSRCNNASILLSLWYVPTNSTYQVRSDSLKRAKRKNIKLPDTLLKFFDPHDDTERLRSSLPLRGSLPHRNVLHAHHDLMDEHNEESFVHVLQAPGIYAAWDRLYSKPVLTEGGFWFYEPDVARFDPAVTDYRSKRLLHRHNIGLLGAHRIEAPDRKRSE